MICYPTPSGLRLMSYGHRNLVGLLNSGKSGQTWPSDINQDSDKISPLPPQKLYIRKTPLMNTTSHWLLIRPILTHGLVGMEFWSRVKVLNCFEQLGHWNEIPALGPKTSESWRGLITNFAASLLSSSTPTQSLDSGNDSNGYGHPKIALVRS
jgi:hypothetical protein